MRDLEPGLHVTPTIRLVRPLGAGGMGSVWVADHLALKTQVVVKFMSAELATSLDAVARFSREAAAAAQVKSPHVVQMLDHGVTPAGVPFIVMELLEGHDLAEHLHARGGRIPLAELAPILAQVAKALARAHERGIVHRDIKPENVFLSDVGGGEVFAKLLDFGIAKGGEGGGSTQGGTKTGATIGTPYYMSPEQIVGAKTIDPRADLWSLGIVAYQAAVGARPFEAETFGALAVMINSAPMPVPSVACAELPPAFDAWFAKACARDPEARFASAKELADALGAIARGEPWSASVAGGAPPASMAFDATAMAPVQAVSSPARTSTDAGMGFPTGMRPAARRGAGPALGIAAAIVAVIALGGGVAWKMTRGHAEIAPDAGVSASASVMTTVTAPEAASAIPAPIALPIAAASASAPPLVARARTQHAPPSRPTAPVAAPAPAPSTQPAPEPASKKKNDDIF